MSDKREVIAVIIAVLWVAFAGLQWLKRRPGTAPGTAGYTRMVKIVMAIVLIAVSAPLWMLLLRAILQD